MTNSKQKGKRGERECAEELRKWWGAEDARRGVQYQGSPESPDVKGIEGLHLECKRTERFRLYAALEQADDERPEGSVPVVWHRKNHKPSVVVIKTEDVPVFVRHFAGIEGRPVYPVGEGDECKNED